MTLGISTDELLKEIERLNNRKINGFAIRDMVKQVGHSEDWCRHKIRELIEEGKAEFAGIEKRPNMMGRTAAIPIYRLINGKSN
jgi:hypothetical protein